MNRILVFVVLAAGAYAARIPADSARGEALFTSLACVQCLIPGVLEAEVPVPGCAGGRRY